MNCCPVRLSTERGATFLEFTMTIGVFMLAFVAFVDVAQLSYRCVSAQFLVSRSIRAANLSVSTTQPAWRGGQISPPISEGNPPVPDKGKPKAPRKSPEGTDLAPDPGEEKANETPTATQGGLNGTNALTIGELPGECESAARAYKARVKELAKNYGLGDIRDENIRLRRLVQPLGYSDSGAAFQPREYIAVEVDVPITVFFSWTSLRYTVRAVGKNEPFSRCAG